jgi:subtilase family serine protease
VAFDVVLRPRDAHALAALATGVSVPGSRTFRHFVSPAQFSARFGQPDAVVGRVSASLRGLGLLVGRVSANGLVLPVTGSAGQVETALGTRLVQVRLASGRVAMANVSAPRLPAAVAAAIQAVIGLSDLITVPSGPTVRRAAPHASAARPASRISARPVRRSGPALSSARAPASSARASSARAPSLRAAGHGARNCPAAGRIAARYRAWTYPQLARAYALSGLYAGGHAGAGTTIALFELERWPAADIRAFQTCYRTAVPVRVIKVDGGATGKPDVEPTLDIETALALAPQASLVVYSAPLASYGRSTIDEYTQIVDQREAQVLSTSYVLCERDVSQLVPGLIASENTIFQQAAAEGITVFAAAGDSGSEACSRTNPARKELSVNDPASQPFVTSVGGTSLTALGPPRMCGMTAARPMAQAEAGSPASGGCRPGRPDAESSAATAAAGPVTRPAGTAGRSRMCQRPPTPSAATSSASTEPGRLWPERARPPRCGRRCSPTSTRRPPPRRTRGS